MDAVNTVLLMGDAPRAGPWGLEGRSGSSFDPLVTKQAAPRGETKIRVMTQAGRSLTRSLSAPAGTRPGRALVLRELHTLCPVLCLCAHEPVSG